MILAHPKFEPRRFKNVRQLFYGAAPMPEAILDKCLELCPNVGMRQAYGMTEAAAAITMLEPSDHANRGKRLRSVGRAMTGVELRIVDPDGNPVPTGQTGEILVRTGSILKEYWKKPEITERSLKDGWYWTGDAGYLDENGYLFVVDRVKDMIVSGGENIYSIEVESALSTHPAVQQVAVIGIPDDVWGETVHAVVVLESGKTVTADELKGHVRAGLAGYKVPKTFSFRSDPLPLSAAGKILKRQLREELE